MDDGRPILPLQKRSRHIQEQNECEVLEKRCIGAIGDEHLEDERERRDAEEPEDERHPDEHLR
jgi:hypothetical protein